MIRRNNPHPPITGEDIPRRARAEALALLAVTVRDDSAPLNVRVQAARELLTRSDQTRQVTRADLEAMSDVQRAELLHLLLVNYETEFPGFVKQFVDAAVEQAVKQMVADEKQRRPRFRRGPNAGGKQVQDGHESGSSSLEKDLP